MKSNKKLRRHLRRLSERMDIGYGEAVSRFYRKDLNEINRGLLYSIHKKTKSSSELILRKEGQARYDDSQHVKRV